MPAGETANRQTTKTDFARYLDAHENEVPALRGIARQYRDNMKRKSSNPSFGFWLRNAHRDMFLSAYTTWWMHRPRLFDHVYDDIPDEDFARNTGIQVTQ